MDKNAWTITKKWKAGDTPMSCFHRVRIEEILEECEGYNVARVTVLGPVPGSNGQHPSSARFGEYENNPIPTLLYQGEPYDTEGLFQDQPMS